MKPGEKVQVKIDFQCEGSHEYKNILSVDYSNRRMQKPIGLLLTEPVID